MYFILNRPFINRSSVLVTVTANMAKDSAYFVESRDQLQKFKYSVNYIDNCNSSRK